MQKRLPLELEVRRQQRRRQTPAARLRARSRSEPASLSGCPRAVRAHEPKVACGNPTRDGQRKPGNERVTRSTRGRENARESAADLADPAKGAAMARQDQPRTPSGGQHLQQLLARSQEPKTTRGLSWVLGLARAEREAPTCPRPFGEAAAYPRVERPGEHHQVKHRTTTRGWTHSLRGCALPGASKLALRRAAPSAAVNEPDTAGEARRVRPRSPAHPTFRYAVRCA